MQTFEKVRLVRELKKWSQQEMAEKLNMSSNGYAKIERGETKLTLPRLKKIANILEIDINDLTQENENGFVIVVGENSAHCIHSNVNMYGNNASDLAMEIEKLKLTLAHKDEIIAQKDREIAAKNNELAAKDEIIALLKKS